MKRSYQLYGIGAALVDMEYSVDEGYLRSQGIEKGHMTLVDGAQLADLLQRLQSSAPRRSSGGSAANTAFAAQSLGAKTFYSCKVSGDETGAYFLADLNRAGVTTNPHPADAPGTSGQCVVLITPDAERTMSTFLGSSADLSVSDINEDALRDSEHLYIEGYLASSPSGRQAAIACREIAEASAVRTSLTLSDASMVRYFRDELGAMLGNGVDCLFCNEEEAMDWARTDRLDVAINELKDIGRSLYVTLGARGALVAAGGSRKEVPGFPVNAIDTNGAGDIYAGACIYGWCAGMPPTEAARFGNFAASRLVVSYGARLKEPQDYQQLLKAFDRA